MPVRAGPSKPANPKATVPSPGRVLPPIAVVSGRLVAVAGAVVVGNVGCKVGVSSREHSTPLPRIDDTRTGLAEADAAAGAANVVRHDEASPVLLLRVQIREVNMRLLLSGFLPVVTFDALSHLTACLA